MGDRCYLTMTLFRRDLPSLLTHLGRGEAAESGNVENEFAEIEPQVPEGVVSITEYEANYAWYTELETFAGEGYIFYGSHSAGGDYEAGLFAGCNEELAWVDTGDHAYMPTIEVYPDGFVSGASLDSAFDYFRVYSDAYFELHGQNWESHKRPANPFRVVKWEQDETETVISTIDGVRVIRV